MEPYRIAGFRCPTCDGSPPLREFHDRLICDECNGLLIDERDFVASCADLANLDIELAHRETTPTKVPRPCPRCERTLTATEVELAPVNVRVYALRCERHGLWFKNAAITRAFALISRRTGGHGGPYYEMGGRVGLDGLPVSRHGGSAGGLAISNWHTRKRRRTPTASPVNLYRDQHLACPRCESGAELRFFGDRYQCESCAGTFVQNAALESMVMDMSGELWDLPAPTGTGGTRGCPICRSAMLVEDIEKVPIDRCTEHGLWFDPSELRVMLERASGEFEPRGVRAWLKKLF